MELIFGRPFSGRNKLSPQMDAVNEAALPMPGAR